MDRPEQADVDVAVEPDIHLVGQDRTLPAADRRVLEAVAGQTLLALRDQQIRAEFADSRRRTEATELRTALLAAAGHDLRTPLISIKAAAGSLRDPHPAAHRPARLPEVLADPDLLDLVIANVVDNALRHGAGEPVVELPHRRLRTRRLRRRRRPTVRPVPAPGRRPRRRRLGLSVARGFTGTLAAGPPRCALPRRVIPTSSCSSWDCPTSTAPR